MKVLIYEHASGGGFAGKPISTSLLCEGFAMLREVTADFKAAGHSVMVFLDSRVVSLAPPLKADKVIPISSFCESENALKSNSQNADASFVIAPETGNLFHSIVESLEASSAISLNCQANAIEKAANKRILEDIIQNKRLRFPKTFTFSVNDDQTQILEEIVRRLNFPIIIKPQNSAGCSAMSLVKEKNQLPKAIEKVGWLKSEKTVVAQEFVQGIPASVSLICGNNKSLPLSLNFQDITFSSPRDISSYNGGKVPFDHPLKNQALEAAKRIVDSFEGLRGYVGVDLVLADGKVFVMEVNPRLTTSYIGLRRVVKFNLAQSIMDAALNNMLPRDPMCEGYSCFSKILLPNIRFSNWNQLFALDEVVSPPFPLVEDSKCALVASYGESEREASLNLLESEEKLRKIAFE